MPAQHSLSPRHRSEHSQSRLRPMDCHIQKECQSCAYINKNYQKSLDAKYEKEFSRIKKQIPHIFGLGVKKATKELGYRTSLKLAVRKSSQTNKRFSIGLFRPESHHIVDITECPLHLPVLQLLLKEIATILEESKIEAWDETSQTGDLKYIAAKASHLTEEIMITFVVSNPNCKKELKEIVKKIRYVPLKISSSHMNIQPEINNAIFGPKTVLLTGSKRLRVPICMLEIESSPTSFSQVNPWQASHIYRRIQQLAGKALPGQMAWDLYCGGGIIGFLLVQNGYRVIACEENPTAIEDAEINKIRNELPENSINFFSGRTEDQLALLNSEKKPDLIVVNPSRRGLADSVRTLIANTLTRGQGGGRLIYLSCNSETLTRDLVVLEEHGLCVRQLEAVDMFPHTDHLEWIAYLSTH